MVVPHLRRLELPHFDVKRWQKLKELYAQFDGIQTGRELTEVLEKLFNEAGNDIKRVVPDRSTEVLNSDGLGSTWCFDGLRVFLEEITTEEERERFFSTTLPFIVTLASSIDEFAPSESILLCSQQRDSGVVLERRFIACILASAFLCALPPPPANSQVRSINFAGFFACFHREEIQKTQAAKLRCFLHYFERFKADWPEFSGRVCYRRQVIPSVSLPNLEEWVSCDLPLCPVIIDSKASIEDSGSHMLQVDFANRFIGGGVLGSGHVQEEIRFCINPELLIAQMCMEAMQDNECVVVTGVERFSCYSGYGKTFDFKGDFVDKSQRDEDGNFQTTIVAIDAAQFKNKPREVQYEEHALVRELNKALVGFYNPNVGSEIISNASESEDSASESEVHVVSSEESENSTVGGSLVLPEASKFQDFSANLVELALTQAFDEVDSNNNKVLEDDSNILTFVMKKSVNGVFGSTPNKARIYSENLLSPTPLPKCLTRTISGSNTPVVPGTPPSSPAVNSLEGTFVDSVAFQTSLTASQFLSTKSFADSLFNSLLSCVELTSSLATDIATAADCPVLAAARTKESFQNSPRDIKSPVKNGDTLISFLSRKAYNSESPPSKSRYSNGFHFNDFVEDLASVVRSTKKKRYYENSDNFTQFPNTRQNLLKEFSHVNSDEREKAESPASKAFDISNAKFFESYASKLSTSIVDSVVSSSRTGNLRNDIEMATLGNEELSTDAVTLNWSVECGSHGDDSQRAMYHGMNSVIEGHLDALVAETISAAVTEAAELCGSEEESSKSEESFQTEHEEKNESENQIKSEYEKSEVISSESSVEQQPSDSNEVMASINAFGEVTREDIIHFAKKLAENVLSDSIAQASEMGHGKAIAAMRRNELNSPGESQVDESTTEELSFSDDEIAEEETLQSFATRLSSLTVRGAVEIAKTCVESLSVNPRVRPVATGNWGCGVFRGDPELKAVIQWVAASAAGCPVVVYHTFGDRRMSRLLRTLISLHSRGWKVSDVIQGILRFRNSARNGTHGSMAHQKLLSFLFRTPQTSL